MERLLENAVKFADEKSEIKLSVDDTEDTVRLSVVNKGKKTLTAKAIADILKPFHLDENALNHTSGTGLGLSVCQALLKTHDSELEIESEKPFFKASFELPKA